MKRTFVLFVSILLTVCIISGFTACSGKPEITEESSSVPADTATVNDAATQTDTFTQAEEEVIEETPKFSRVMWADIDGLSEYLKKEVENYGSLNVGKNTISNNNCCYDFTAPSAGYYTVDPGHKVAVAYADKMISNTVPEGTADCFGVGGGFKDGLWHYVGEEVSDTMPVYLEKGDVIYMRFYDIDVEKEGSNLVDGLGTAVIDFLGEITTATFDLGNICLDDCYIDGNDISLKANTPVEISFSEGQRYKKTFLAGTADAVTSGEHTIEVDITRGHGFKTKATFYRLGEVIEKVELPGSYIPIVSLKLGENEGKVATYPDYINVTLKDGTIKKAERKELTEGEEDSGFEFNYSGDAVNTLYLRVTANSSGRPVLQVVYTDNGSGDAKDVVLAEYDAIRA